jgi:hypothetical protein
VANVPVVGKVKLVVLEVVNVRLCPPEVINEDPLAKVNVALEAGAVNRILLYEVAETFPFASITPETEDDEPVEVYKLPPIPTPPVTTKAPEVVLVEAVVFVTAKPESDTKPVKGFITNEETLDNPNPELEAELTTGIKNCALTTVGVIATDEAAEGGTACQVGALPVPLEVRTCPEVAEVA